MRRPIALVLCLVLSLLSISSISFAVSNPTSLEVPLNVSAYNENGSIMIRWSVPQSIIGYFNSYELEGYILYCIDYKIDNGAWHYSTDKMTESLYDGDSPLMGYADNLSKDEANAMETFIIPGFIGAGQAFDFKNHTYSFRMRFFFEQDGVSTYVTSPWSNTASIGKDSTTAMFTSLDAPSGLKAELKTRSDGSPYFYLTWTNPQSVIDINKSYPIEYKVDFKVGNGKWYSEENTHEWWGADDLSSSCEFDPIEKKLVDRIEIEENVYYFRILYSFETMDLPHVYSVFSNTASLGTPSFYSNASDYAVGFLDRAEELGIITDRMMGQDMTQPITREEFAELAVKFYGVVTGKTAAAISPNPFKDCVNPEVLKAYNLKISTGTGDGTTFEPKSKLLRQQMAAMITRTLKACFGDNFTMDVSGQPDFKDQKSILGYAVGPTKFMAKYGITTGDGKGSFVPNNYCTRQEAIIFLVRAYDKQDQYLK